MICLPCNFGYPKKVFKKRLKKKKYDSFMSMGHKNLLRVFCISNIFYEAQTLYR